MAGVEYGAVVQLGQLLSGQLAGHLDGMKEMESHEENGQQVTGNVATEMTKYTILNMYQCTIIAHHYTVICAFENIN